MSVASIEMRKGEFVATVCDLQSQRASAIVIAQQALISRKSSGFSVDHGLEAEFGDADSDDVDRTLSVHRFGNKEAADGLKPAIVVQTLS